MLDNALTNVNDDCYLISL